MIPTLRACELLDELWPKVRYPGKPIPTPSETEAAMAAAADVRAAARHGLESP